jgi:hypothetical protein
MSDAVDHPDHYNANPSGVECIDVVEHMPFNVGNAVKYLWRAGHKGNLLEDLRKAAWYIEREIQRQSSPVPSPIVRAVRAHEKRTIEDAIRRGGFVRPPGDRIPGRDA